MDGFDGKKYLPPAALAQSPALIPEQIKFCHKTNHLINFALAIISSFLYSYFFSCLRPARDAGVLSVMINE